MSEDKAGGLTGGPIRRLLRDVRKPADLFGSLHMTWLHVCLFAVVIGIYVGVINQIPALYDTSFRDIAVTHEWWVLFAVLIVCNSRGWLDAGLKCFVFFLISQPVIYLVELPTVALETSMQYWLNIWLPVTILTLPGGAIAWFARRQDAPGAVILGIGNALVGTHGVHYTLAACSAFPRHLLSALSCAGIIVFLVLCIQRKRWTRLLSAGTTVLIVACIVLYACLNGLKI